VRRCVAVGPFVKMRRWPHHAFRRQYHLSRQLGCLVGQLK
jgi:hypothetical protein